MPRVLDGLGRAHVSGRRLRRVCAALTAACLILPSPARGERHGGVDRFRWAIKTCTDFQADQIRNEIETTIGQLCALPRPIRVTSFSPRFGPAEFTVYTVTAQ